MVLEEGLLVAEDFNVFVVVGRVQQLLGDELLQVGHRGKRRAANELPVEVGLESDGFVGSFAFKKNVDLNENIR